MPQKRPPIRVHLLVALALIATLFAPAPDAAAQGNEVTETIVGRRSGRTWKVHRDGVEQGTAWRQLGFDDSAWDDTSVKFYERHGTVRGNGAWGYYFREEFEITDTFQISDLDLSVYYDDAIVMYLNGTEVYRTIRNNLPDTTEVPVGAVMPVDTSVPFGGAEDYYVEIPASSNYCEQGCVNNGATDPIDASLLVEGTNVFAVMGWTTFSSDLGFDLAIDVVRNLDAPLPDRVVINEISASNDTVLDEDDDTPDWFELHNPGENPVSLDGWSVEDSESSWTFPNVTVAAGGHLRVFASSKDRNPVDGSNLHTNFKLSKEGDSLRVLDANSIVRDDTDVLPRQITDVTYGRPLDDDEGDFAYLALPTPGAPNTPASTALAPVLRPFSNRLYNVGDPVELAIDAFDPEGGFLSHSMPNNQNLAVDNATGVITGTATEVGEFVFQVTVTDDTQQSATQGVLFTVVEAAAPTTPLVLNEYNAVAPDRELNGVPDPEFGPALGNGGDWYEFVVVEDLLDIRGWTLQLWDRDRDDEIMERAASLTFGDDFFLADLAAGTIITISEDYPDDLSYDPDNGDWSINFQANSDTPGAMFSVQESFNSTRDDQQVEIRDADGVLRSPIVGETEAWDLAQGGVSGGEVLNLCVDPSADSAVSATEDYRDSGSSTFGAPNTCEWADPLDAANVVTFDQDFTSLRDDAGLRGDVNCDGAVTIVDAMFIAQFAATNRTDTGSCPIDSATEINATRGDFNVAAGFNIADALLISQCAALVGDPEICD